MYLGREQHLGQSCRVMAARPTGRRVLVTRRVTQGLTMLPQQSKDVGRNGLKGKAI
jgi:hypothetical protein